MTKYGTPFISPRELSLLTTRHHPFDRAGWFYELKYDGFRLLMRKVRDTVTLLTRNGHDLTAAFPELVHEAGALEDCTLDGELVLLEANGCPNFDALCRRAWSRRPSRIVQPNALPAVVFVFDLLTHRARDLRPLPLRARKDALQAILAGGHRVRYLHHVEGRGRDLFEAAAALGMEGIVAKNSEAPYVAGRSGDWIKIKTPSGRALMRERAQAWHRLASVR